MRLVEIPKLQRNRPPIGLPALLHGFQSLMQTVAADNPFRAGAGELMGLTGSMKIKIEGKKHFYEFDYMLPSAK